MRDLLAFSLIFVLLFPLRLFGVVFLNEPIYFFSIFFSVVGLLYSSKYSVSTYLVATYFLCFTFFYVTILMMIPPRNFLVKDLVEVFKPSIFLLIFLFGVSASKAFRPVSLESFTVYVSVLSIFFSFLVFVPPLHPFIDVFKARPSSGNLFHFFRFSGTLGYPGGFGYWLTLAYALVLSALFRAEGKFYRLMFLLSFIVVGIILTGSRGALAIAIILTFVISCFKPFSRIGIFVFTFFVVVFLLLLYLVFYSGMELSFITHFASFIDNPLGGTFTHRANELIRLANSLADGYIFGSGPDNFNLQRDFGPIESAYYFYGVKFGILGLIFYIGLIVYLVFAVIRFPVFSVLWSSSIWAFFNVSVAAVSNSITEEYKSFFLFFILLGFIHGYLFEKGAFLTASRCPSKARSDILSS